MNSLFTMDSFEQVFWALALYLLIRILREDRPNLWLAFGLVAGVSLTDKVTFLYFGVALIVGLLLTPSRSQFRHWQLWAGGAIALAFLSPYILWNAAHGFPTLEFWREYGQKLANAGPLDFILQQALTLNPFALPVWLAGLVFFFRPGGKPYRLFGWMYLMLLAIFMIQGAKFYFLAPFYPVLFAAGAAQFERWIAVRRMAWFKPASLIFIGLAGLILAPMAMQILPLQWEIRYLEIGSSKLRVQAEKANSGVLPQNLADQFGWRELADTMAGIYHGLPADDQAKACIFAENYGEAGALEFFGPSRGLPPVISGHNSYFLWGPGRCTGEVILYLGNASTSELHSLFNTVKYAGWTSCDYCMPYENGRPIYLCKGIKRPLNEVWEELKYYI